MSVTDKMTVPLGISGTRLVSLLTPPLPTTPINIQIDLTRPIDEEEGEVADSLLEERSRKGLLNYLGGLYEALAGAYGHGHDIVLTLETVHPEFTRGKEAVYGYGCMGGTFDRLHIGHLILLSAGVLATTSGLKVGVTDDSMLTQKAHAELIQPVEFRIAEVERVLARLLPGHSFDVFPIYDPWGPTREDPVLDAMVVSKETEAGGEAIRKARIENGFPEIGVVVVDLVQGDSAPGFKVSSSTLRAQEAARNQ